MKKGLSLLLTICLTISMAYVPLYAFESEQDETGKDLLEVLNEETEVLEEPTGVYSLFGENKASYYSMQAETIHNYGNSDTDTIISLPLTGVPVTESFTFETDIVMKNNNASNLKLNLYSSVDYGAEKARIIGISFGQEFMTADNDKNNMYGKTAVLPYDTGANGNEWSYIMLPGLMEKEIYKNIKIYFDFAKRTYDVYIDNYLVANDKYFTNEDAADLTAAELVVPKNGTHYRLKNTAITNGYNGLFIQPVKIYNASNIEQSGLTIGETFTARFKALKSNGANLDFSMRVNHNGQTQTVNKTLLANETWQDFEYTFIASAASENITMGGYDSHNNEVIRKSGFICTPTVKSQAKVFVIGDSTVGPHTGATGWGQVILGFTNENAIVRAFGRSGTSTRTYWNSGRTDVMGYEMTEGDYLLFQLGHNDCAAAGTGTGVKNTTISEYKAYIARYIKFAREKGVHLVFVTPPTQMRVGSTNQFELADTATPLYERVAAMKEMAEDYNIPLIDLYAQSRAGFRNVLDIDGNLNRIYVDGTHFTETGAKYLAYYVTQGFTALANGAQHLVQMMEAPNKDVLAGLIDANEQKSQVDYTASSFAAFMAEMNNSLFILNNPLAVQEDIDNQVEALKNAIDNLIVDDPSLGVSVYATKDAHTQRGAAGSVFNSDIVLAKFPTTETETSTARRAFVGFNITNIPENASQVILKLYVIQLGSNASYEDTIYVHSTTDNWSESTLTWNNMPTVYSSAPLATFGPLNIFSTNANYDAVKGFVDLDVTQYVLSEKAKGTTNISFAIGATASQSSYCAFSSKENVDGNGPRLVTSGASPKTIGEMKKEDLEAIFIEDYINDTSIDKITQSLKALPHAGSANGYSITWKSSRPDILSNSGEIVSRPQYNTEVKLTASIVSDGFEHARDFNLTVFMNTDGWTDASYINYELNQLEFSDFSTQNPNQVYTDIILPSISKSEFCTYSWSVSDSASASITDNVASFKIKNDIEASLNLIVTALRGTTILTKTFPIKLIRGFSENLIAKNQASISVSSGVGRDAVTRDFDTYWEASSRDDTNRITFTFNLETKINSALFVERGNVIKGFTIAYSSDGKNWSTAYTGTTLGDRQRNLIEFKEFSAKTVRFTVTAKGEGTVSLYTAELYDALISDTQKLTADIRAISIPKMATSNIILPLFGPNGSSIKWTSSNTKYITHTGVVNRQATESPTVVLTAEYVNGNASDFVAYHVTVPANFNSNGGSGSGGGGGGSVVPFVPVFENPIPIYEKPIIAFDDVPEDFWAHDFISNLAKKNIVSIETNTFRPNDSITREEFLKLIMLTAKIPLGGSAVFTDVNRNEWYYQYIAAAYQYGIAKGNADGSFGVGNKITRQDMAVMAARLLDMNNKLQEDGELFFADSGEVSEYAKDAVAQLMHMEIMIGNENRFMPLSNATRAEAAKIIALIGDVINGQEELK